MTVSRHRDRGFPLLPVWQLLTNPGTRSAAVTFPAPPIEYDEQAETTVRVSTLELFFDLVFVFTLTQFTRLLAVELTITGLAKVGLLFSVTWYAYDRQRRLPRSPRSQSASRSRPQHR